MASQPKVEYAQVEVNLGREVILMVLIYSSFNHSHIISVYVCVCVCVCVSLCLIAGIFRDKTMADK